jgi:hypothetical protein
MKINKIFPNNLFETKIIRSVYDLIEKSTFHGIPNIIRTDKSITRSIWTIFTILSTIICILIIKKSIINYFDYNYVTNIDIIYEQPMEFPTISMCSCSLNIINMTLNKFLKSCIFNNFNCKNEKYFMAFNDPVYKTCFRFNSGKQTNDSKLQATIAGRSGGLQVEVKETNGLLIFIHASSNPPYPNENYNNINGNSIFVSTGFSTDLAIDKTVTKRLGLPYNECVKSIESSDDLNYNLNNKTLYMFIKNLNETYSQKRCFKLCFDLDYINNNPCNCTNNVTIGSVWQKCFIEMENQDLNGCTSLYKNNFTSHNMINECSKYCPLECDFEQYEAFLSFHVPENMSKNESLKLKIYFKDLTYILISQEPKIELFDLISGIGGLLGLFLGVSFLSFIEIFEILFEVIYLLIGSYMRRTKTNHSLS